MPVTYMKAARVEDISLGQVKTFDIEREHITICNVDDVFYAINDFCSHDGGMLGRGELHGNIIECSRHGARFDVTNGKAMAPPAVRPIRTFPVRVNDGYIEVGIEVSNRRHSR